MADIVLRPTIGRIAAALSRWEGTRLHLDNVIWKPPGASGLTMHHDGSYGHYMVPNAMTSMWMRSHVELLPCNAACTDKWRDVRFVEGTDRILSHLPALFSRFGG